MSFPDFSSSAGYLSTGAASVTGGEGVYNNAAVGDNLRQAILTAGKTYRITITIKTLASGNFRVYAGVSGPGTIRNTIGTYVQDIVCVGSNEVSLQARTAGTTATVGLFSVKEVLG